MSTVWARYENGVLKPLEPLDLQEGAEVSVSVEQEVPASAAGSVLEMFDRLRNSAPSNVWEGMPTDGAKNYKHYLYGAPKVED